MRSGIIALAVACLMIQKAHTQDAPAVDGLPSLGCMLQPSKKVEVSSPVPGVLETVKVKRGETVRKGDTLFTLRAGVERAGVEVAVVAADFAGRELARNEKLYADELLSVHERDQVETDLLMAEKELELKRQELALRTVSSPISGVVVDRFLEEGEYVSVDPVLGLAKLDPLHVDLLLLSDYFGSIAVGQELLISAAPALSEARVAKVSTVDPLIDPASSTFRVQLVMDNPGNAIPAGLRCIAQLAKEALPNE